MKTYTKIVLKYNKPKFQSYHSGDEFYVDLDPNSGGYPYQVNAHNAHDFKTVEKAQAYPTSSWDDFRVVELIFTVTEKAL